MGHLASTTLVTLTNEQSPNKDGSNGASTAQAGCPPRGSPLVSPGRGSGTGRVGAQRAAKGARQAELMSAYSEACRALEELDELQGADKKQQALN